MIWVIFSCINTDFIDRYCVNLKGLLHLQKFLKYQPSNDVAKKSDAFRPEEIEKILNNLKDRKIPKNTLYGVGIALLYFGLLKGSKVHNVEFKDVRLLNKNGGEKIEVTFTHDHKRQNNGFKFYVVEQYSLCFNVISMRSERKR